MEEFLKFMVSGLVNNPDSIVITTSQEDNITTLTLKIAKEDMGFLIGKNGITLNHIKNMLSFYCYKISKDKKVSLKILE